MALIKSVRSSDPKHLKLAFSFLGLKEGAGPKNNLTVIRFYKDVGHSWVKQDSVAWCAAFVGAMLARSGLPHSGSLATRSYLSWGKKTTHPKRGDVVVFKRGNSSWRGHVGFYLGESGGRIYVIGGNQRDAVTVTSKTKSSLLGYRGPVTLRNSRTAKALAISAIGTGVMFTQLHSMDGWLLLSILMIVVGLAWAGWARYADWKAKAR